MTEATAAEGRARPVAAPGTDRATARPRPRKGASR